MLIKESKFAWYVLWHKNRSAINMIFVASCKSYTHSHIVLSEHNIQLNI